MSPEQVASWGSCLLSDCFSSFSRKVKRNPFGRIAVFYLEKRSLNILRLLASGKNETDRFTLVRIRKMRRLVQNVEFICWPAWKHWNCVYAFFVDYECGYESLLDSHPDLAKDCFRQLAEIPEKIASVIGEDSNSYVLKMSEQAKGVSCVQGG
jgi:hypothetical protein